MSLRFTRSRTIPEWELDELLKLVFEIATVDDEFGTSFSSHQKWEIVSENLIANGVHRNSPQCRRKWDTLLSEYQAIKDWESHLGTGSGGHQTYWVLGVKRRRELNLPEGFDQDLFRSMDDLIEKRQRRTKCEDGDGEGEENLIDGGEVAMTDGGERVDADLVVAEPLGSSGDYEARCMINDLYEKWCNLTKFTERIEAALEGGLLKNSKTKRCLDLKIQKSKEVDFTRQEADELIKIFDDLNEVLNNTQ